MATRAICRVAMVAFPEGPITLLGEAIARLAVVPEAATAVEDIAAEVAGSMAAVVAALVVVATVIPVAMGADGVQI